MVNAAIARKAVLGLDVGKSSHWACLVTGDGEVTVNSPVDNSEDDLDRLFSQVDPGTLVVVDQVRNIGALAIRRARMAGLDVAYLPGIAAHGAARLFAGDAKTDERAYGRLDDGRAFGCACRGLRRAGLHNGEGRFPGSL